MAKQERNYTINLRRDFVKVPRHRRSKRAISFIKNYLKKHMKTEDVRLGKHLNEYVWGRGIKNPPGKVSLTATFEDGYVTAELAGKTYAVAKVQTEVKEEPTGLKGKLQSAIKGNDGAKEEPAEEEAKPEETQQDKKPADDKKADKKD